MQLITDVSVQKGTNLLKPTRQTVQANLVFESPPMPPPPADLLIITQPVTKQASSCSSLNLPSWKSNLKLSLHALSLV